MPIHEPFFRPCNGEVGLTKATRRLWEAKNPPKAPEPPKQYIPNVVYFMGHTGFYEFNGKEVRKIS